MGFVLWLMASGRIGVVRYDWVGDKEENFLVYKVSGHSGSPSLQVCPIRPGLSSRDVTHFSRSQH